MKDSDAIESVLSILKKDCDDPAQQIIKHGEVLVQIGAVLRGKTPAEARAIMTAVYNLVQVMPVHVENGRKPT